MQSLSDNNELFYTCFSPLRFELYRSTAAKILAYLYLVQTIDIQPIGS